MGRLPLAMIVSVVLFLLSGCACMKSDDYEAALNMSAGLLIDKGLPAANEHLDSLVAQGRISRYQSDLLKQALIKLSAKINAPSAPDASK